MKKIVALILGIALIVPLSARTKKGNGRNGIKMFDAAIIGAGQLKMWITNYGIFAHDVVSDNSGAWWPANYRNETYIFGAGLWVGGIVNGDTNVTCGYNPNSGRGEFVPAKITDIAQPSPTDPADRVYVYGNIPPGYSWPLKNHAGSDSTLSIQDSYEVFNDNDPSQHFVAENKPLHVAVVQQTYSFIGPLKENIIFFIQHIVNVGNDTIKNMYVGPTFDNDIGNESGTNANDLVGFVRSYVFGNDTVNLNMAYQYQTVPEPGWHHMPGVVASMFLVPDSNSVYADTTTYPKGFASVTPIATDTVVLIDPDDPEVNDTIYPGEPLGMTAFRIFTISIDPQNKIQRYLVMAGYDYTANPPYYDPFMRDVYGPGDKRYLQVSGPFDLPPGDTVNLAFAVFVAPDTASLFPVARQVLEIFNSGFAGPKPPTQPKLTVTPLDKKVVLYWDNSAEVDTDAYYFQVSNPYLPNGDTNRLYNPAYRPLDFAGYRLLRSIDLVNWDTLGVWDKKDGYTVVYTDSVINFNGQVIYTDSIILGSETGLTHSYVDSNLINGLKYTYKLEAYDINYSNYVIDSATGEVIGIQPFSLYNVATAEAVPQSKPANLVPPTSNVSNFGLSNALKLSSFVATYDTSILKPGTYTLQFINKYPSGLTGQSPYDSVFYVIKKGDSLVIDTTHLNFSEVTNVVWINPTQYITVKHWIGKPDYPVTFNGVALDMQVDVAKDSFFFIVDSTLWGDTPGSVWKLYLYRGDASFQDSVHSNWIHPKFPAYFYPGDYYITWHRNGNWLKATVYDSLRNIQLQFDPTRKTQGGYGWTFRYGPGGVARDSIDVTTNPRIILGISLAGSPFFIFVRDTNSVPPQDGEVWHISTYYNDQIGLRPPFTPADSSEIKVTAPTFTTDYTLDSIQVVPNPYIVMTPFDRSKLLRKGIRFTHLPSKCTIRIYTLTGDLIAKIEHDSAKDGGEAIWNLLTQYGMRPASGVYIYHVETPDGKTKIGKFSVIF